MCCFGKEIDFNPVGGINFANDLVDYLSYSVFVLHDSKTNERSFELDLNPFNSRKIIYVSINKEQEKNVEATKIDLTSLSTDDHKSNDKMFGNTVFIVNGLYNVSFESNFIKLTTLSLGNYFDSDIKIFPLGTISNSKSYSWPIVLKKDCNFVALCNALKNGKLKNAQ